MEKLPQVEAAKALMNEATTWSVVKWLREKKRVRAVADLANAELDRLRQQIQSAWPEDLRSEYQAMTTGAQNGNSRRSSRNIEKKSQDLLRQLRQADYEAVNARMDAEKTFDDAERQLSTRMARDGCQKAILSWQLHEKAIQRAEGLLRLR